MMHPFHKLFVVLQDGNTNGREVAMYRISSYVILGKEIPERFRIVESRDFTTPVSLMS
jgi:hypothetical protein